MANNGHAECDKAIEYCSLLLLLFVCPFGRLDRVNGESKYTEQQYAHSWNFFSFSENFFFPVQFLSHRRIANNVFENRKK